MIALITPTGARADQIKLCARWMKNQSYDGEVLWVIVDDAVPKTTDFITADFRENWKIAKVYPSPAWSFGQNTQARNIRDGINYILSNYRIVGWNGHPANIEAIFIIEDDDYYSPLYLQVMMAHFDNYTAIGERDTIYYNVTTRSYMVNNNRQHVSLFQLAIKPKVLNLFMQCLNHKFIDYNFFNHMKAQGYWQRNEILIFRDIDLGIGIKGMPGRGGIGAGHKMSNRANKDTALKYLYSKIGDDAKQYERYYRFGDKPRNSLFVKRGV